jgi:hypothetical protein
MSKGKNSGKPVSGILPTVNLVNPDGQRVGGKAEDTPAQDFERLVSEFMGGAMTPFAAGGHAKTAATARTLAALLPRVEAAGGVFLPSGAGSAKHLAIQWLYNNNRARADGKHLHWLAVKGRSKTYTAALNRLLAALLAPGCAVHELLARLAVARSRGAPPCPEVEAGMAVDTLLAEAWRTVEAGKAARPGKAGKAAGTPAPGTSGNEWTPELWPQHARDALDEDPHHRDKLYEAMREAHRFAEEGRRSEAYRVGKKAQRIWSKHFIKPRAADGKPPIGKLKWRFFAFAEMWSRKGAEVTPVRVEPARQRRDAPGARGNSYEEMRVRETFELIKGLATARGGGARVVASRVAQRIRQMRGQGVDSLNGLADIADAMLSVINVIENNNN